MNVCHVEYSCTWRSGGSGASVWSWQSWVTRETRDTFLSWSTWYTCRIHTCTHTIILTTVREVALRTKSTLWSVTEGQWKYEAVPGIPGSPLDPFKAGGEKLGPGGPGAPESPLSPLTPGPPGEPSLPGNPGSPVHKDISEVVVSIWWYLAGSCGTLKQHTNHQFCWTVSAKTNSTSVLKIKGIRGILWMKCWIVVDVWMWIPLSPEAPGPPGPPGPPEGPGDPMGPVSPFWPAGKHYKAI